MVVARTSGKGMENDPWRTVDDCFPWEAVVRQELFVFRQKAKLTSDGQRLALGLVSRQSLKFLDARAPQIHVLIESDRFGFVTGDFYTQGVVVRRDEPGDGEYFPTRRVSDMEHEWRPVNAYLVAATEGRLFAVSGEFLQVSNFIDDRFGRHADSGLMDGRV